MDCYGHRILVKMCYAMVRKCIFGMKPTEFVPDIKKNVFTKGLLINSGCHSNEKAEIEMLVTSLKFALMDCYGHRILVKMCYAMVRKCIFGMNPTEFVPDIKKNVFMKGLLINSGCHSNEKAVLVKV